MTFSSVFERAKYGGNVDDSTSITLTKQWYQSLNHIGCAYHIGSEIIDIGFRWTKERVSVLLHVMHCFTYMVRTSDFIEPTPLLLIRTSMPSGANCEILSVAAYIEQGFMSIHVSVTMHDSFTLTEATSVISIVTACTCLPSTKDFRASEPSGFLAHAITVSPLFLSCLTNSAPIPREVPVTTQVKPIVKVKERKLCTQQFSSSLDL